MGQFKLIMGKLIMRNIVNKLFHTTLYMLISMCSYLGNAMELPTNVVSSANETSAFVLPPPDEKTAEFCPSEKTVASEHITALIEQGMQRIIVRNPTPKLSSWLGYTEVGQACKEGSTITHIESQLTSALDVSYLLYGLEGIENSTLQSLMLGTLYGQNCKTLLPKVIKSSLSLKELFLECNARASSRYMPQVFRALQDSSVKNLTVKNAYIIEGASQALGEYLKENKTLKSLTLESCWVPLKILPDFMGKICDNQSLQILVMRNNKSSMQVHTARCLANGLIKIVKNKSCGLVQVDLSDNKLDDDFIQTMVKILEKEWTKDWPLKIILTGNLFTKTTQGKFAEYSKLIL